MASVLHISRPKKTLPDQKRPNRVPHCIGSPGFI